MPRIENTKTTEADILFAKRLKEARENAGLKQFELADMADVTPATLSAYEALSEDSKGKKPSLHNAIELAKILHVSLDWLCGLSNEVSSPYSNLLMQLMEYKTKVGNVDMFIDKIMPTESIFKGLPSYRKSFTSEPMHTDENIEDYVVSEQLESMPAVAITIKNPLIVKFLTDWITMYQNYLDGVIDKEIYDLWLEKRLKEVNHEQIKQNMESDVAGYRINKYRNTLTNNGGE